MTYITEPKLPFFLEKTITFAEKRMRAKMMPARLLLWAPKAFVSSMILEGLIAHANGKVDGRLLKLIRMQVSLLIACPFCIDMNSQKFRDFDITEEEIHAMQRKVSIKHVSSFSKKEKLTLYYIRGLVSTPIQHNPKVIHRMTELFDEKEFATIVTTIAQVDYWTRVIQGFGIQPAGFLDTCDWELIERYFTVKENALDYVYGGKKVSYEEFLQINEQSNLRLEYINGEIIVMTSPNVMHQMILNRLIYIFQVWFEDKPCQPFVAPFDVHLKKKDLKDPDVVQPDLLVICDLNQEVNKAGRYTGTPTLVVEILSESTRSKDMVDKLNSYMLSGTKEYWVVDTKHNKIMVYEFVEAAIDRMSIYETGICSSFYFEGLEVMVEKIFTSY